MFLNFQKSIQIHVKEFIFSKPAGLALANNFPKNELFHGYFSRILTTFWEYLLQGAYLDGYLRVRDVLKN